MPHIVSSHFPIRVLVVDDEPVTRSILCSGLEAEGYVVLEARGKEELLRCLERVPISLITLDIVYAGEVGLQLAREVRAQHNVPIIIISGNSGPADRVMGFEQGADEYDDYIVKPFHIKEVLMRIRRVLRRYELEAGSGDRRTSFEVHPERYEFEVGILDVVRHELRARSGKQIRLTDAEFGLLVIFLRRPARIQSRDELAYFLTGRKWSPEDRSIDGLVARLRRKVDSNYEFPRIIKSVRGIGYVFTGDVRRLDNS